jgi:hypothetical protein
MRVINGTALLVHPFSSDWYVGGSVLEIRRIRGRELHKRHQWTPRFTVVEILTGIMSTRNLEQIFATQSEAETYAHHAARQWIDNGRPGLDVKP